MMKEKLISAWSGIPMLLFTLTMLIVPIVAIIMAVRGSERGDRPVAIIVAWLLVWLVDLIAMAGFFTIQPNQGVAYLDDGTMVVVDDGRARLGQTVDIVVTSVLQTTAGRMVFSKISEESRLLPVAERQGASRASS